MSRIESIGMTRSQGRPASLNEARRALVNPDLRSVVLGSRADSLDLREQVAMASDTHACLDEAAKASLAGRLFVVDHATLVDDLDLIADAMRGASFGRRSRRRRFSCPVSKAAPARCSSSSASKSRPDLLTALPMQEHETFFWAVPGFAADCDGTCRPNHGGAARGHRRPRPQADRAAEMSAHVLFDLRQSIRAASQPSIACSAIAGMAEFYTNVGSA